jgi:hypothetical protein
MGVGWDPARAVLVTAAALLATAVVVAVVHVVVLRMGRRDPMLRTLSGRGRHPFGLLVLIVALLLARPEQGADPATVDLVRHVLTLLLIGTAAWLFARIALVAQEAALRRFDLSVPDNLRVRRLHTQVIVIRRVTVAVVFVAAFAGMMLTFDSASSARSWAWPPRPR